MPQDNEQAANFHLEIAIQHLRYAAKCLLHKAPADPQSLYRPQELAGNELLLIADHLCNVKTVAGHAVNIRQPV